MSVYDLDLPALQSLVESWNEPPYRARQIWEGLYKRLYGSWAEFTNLPKALRGRLDQELNLVALIPSATASSVDRQTEKTAFRLHDGLQIESVLMRYSKRATICIST